MGTLNIFGDMVWFWNVVVRMSEELKLCPFCGGKAELIESGPSGKESVTHWQARCSRVLSGCAGSEIDTWKCTSTDALKSWNTRSDAGLIKEQAKNISLSKKIVELNREADVLNAELYRLNA